MLFSGMLKSLEKRCFFWQESRKKIVNEGNKIQDKLLAFFRRGTVNRVLGICSVVFLFNLTSLQKALAFGLDPFASFKLKNITMLLVYESH